MSYYQIIFHVVESNFVKQIKNLCHRTQIHTLIVSFRRVRFASLGRFRSVPFRFVRSICICIIRLLFQKIRIFLSSCLHSLLFLFLFFWFSNIFCFNLSFQKMKRVSLSDFWWSWSASNIIFIRYYKRCGT